MEDETKVSRGVILTNLGYLRLQLPSGKTFKRDIQVRTSDGEKENLILLVNVSEGNVKLETFSRGLIGEYSKNDLYKNIWNEKEFKRYILECIEVILNRFNKKLGVNYLLYPLNVFNVKDSY